MRRLKILAVAGLILTVSATAGATTYGGNVDPLWNLGTGQPTGNFVVDDNGDVQTALRATGRYTGPLAPVNTEGRYYAFPGISAYPPPGVATWDFCFHANVDTSVPAIADPVSGLIVYVAPPSPSLTLDNVNIYLVVDDDPTVGLSSGVVVDLKLAAEAAAAAAGATIDWTLFVGIRGAENLGFSWLATVAAMQGKTWSFDLNAIGEYEFSLAVYDKGTMNLLSQTDMKVTVVPEPLTMLAVFTGITGLAGYVRRRNVPGGRKRA